MAAELPTPTVDVPRDGLERLLWVASCVLSLTATAGQRRLAAVAGALVVAASLLHGDLEVAGVGFLVGFVGLDALRRRVAASPRLHLWLSVAHAVAALLAFDHRISGFLPWPWQPPVRVGPGSTAFTSVLNVDKIVVGSVLLLGLRGCNCVDARAPATNLRRLGAALPVALATVVSLLGPALASGFVRFEPHLDAYFFTWSLHNLALVVVHEEAMFRGILPRLLERAVPRLAMGSLGNVLGCAIAFGVYHHRGGAANVALATVAGLGYAAAGRRAGSLAGGVLAHLLLNAVHFLGFTYPAARRGV